MSDREIFRSNLNYYLSMTGYKQKDLADYVGAKTTTVSGWTRGISYPRADAMEKIAMFFGIPTSKLISEPAMDEEINETIHHELPKTDDIRLLVRDLNKLSPEQITQAKDMFRMMFRITNPELFKEDDDHDP